MKGWRATVYAFRTFLADECLGQRARQTGKLPILKVQGSDRSRLQPLPIQAGHVSRFEVRRGWLRVYPSFESHMARPAVHRGGGRDTGAGAMSRSARLTSLAPVSGSASSPIVSPIRPLVIAATGKMRAAYRARPTGAQLPPPVARAWSWRRVACRSSPI